MYDPDGMSADAEQLPSLREATPTAPRRIRVMVLDDDDCVRHVVTQMLRRRNCDVIAFSDARSCCAHANSACDCPCQNDGICADVLITDIKMPGLDGLDYLDVLTRHGCQIPFRAVMSAFWTAESLDRARHHGCRIFVKPVGVFEIDRWLETIECVIDYDRPVVDHYRS